MKSILRRAVQSFVFFLLRALPQSWRIRCYLKVPRNPFAQGGFAGAIRRTRVAPHHYLMDLRMDDWMERMAARIGCYYEAVATESLRTLLRSGDCFVDIGANCGFLTLTGARLVGESGRVLAFEPNAMLVKRLQDCLEINAIRHVAVHPYAVGPAAGEAVLNVTEHSGTSSLRPGNSPMRQTVPVVTADSYLSSIPCDIFTLVKIDVEGWEASVLAGCNELLARANTAFFVEVTDKWLQEAGSSAGDLFALFHARQYSAYVPRVDVFSRLQFERVSAPLTSVDQYDVLFLRESDFRARLNSQ
jgi:FkbM family methyltransferase